MNLPHHARVPYTPGLYVGRNHKNSIVRAARSLALGCLFALVCLGRQHLDRPAGLFDSRNCRFGCAGYRKRHFGLEFADAKEAHAVFFPAQHAGLDQRSNIYTRGRIELAGIDRRLDAAQVDLIVPFGERRVAKSALGQTPVERHLAALETLDADTGTRGLALAAAAAGLAGTGANAATDPAADRKST